MINNRMQMAQAGKRRRDEWRFKKLIKATAFSFYCQRLPSHGDADFFVACAGCHGADGNSTQEGIPSLAGQREDYLVAALTAYRDDERGGADTTMIDVMYDISDAEIRALAHFLSRQAT